LLFFLTILVNYISALLYILISKYNSGTFYDKM
jgi:hypothetical protein